MQNGQRPVSIGFFVALGHSVVVVLVAAAVAATASALEARFESWKGVGSIVSTSVSAIFLFLIAGMNIAIFRGVWHALQMRMQEIRHLLLYLSVNRRTINPYLVLTNSRRFVGNLGRARVDEYKVAARNDLLLWRNRQTRGDCQGVAWRAE